MADATCSVDGCATRSKARGWCDKHYQRWKHHGDPAYTSPLTDRRSHAGKVCSVEGCDRPRRKRAWCANHYTHWRNHGDAEAPYKHKWSTDYVCVVCGSDVERGSGRRKHCSQSCQVADYRHNGERPSHAECTLCGREFSLGRRDGRFQRTDTKWCPDCGRDSPEAMRLKRYGITPEAYDAALDQGCPICLRKVDSLHVDHDHGCCPARTHRLCGKCTRGLLCGSCNRALGLLRDDPEAFARAQAYLTT